MVLDDVLFLNSLCVQKHQNRDDPEHNVGNDRKNWHDVEIRVFAVEAGKIDVPNAD